MTVVNITSTIGTTCHYTFTPQAIVDVTGSNLGLTLPDIITSWVFEVTDNTPVQLTVPLDNAYTWDVYLRFQGAPPIIFPTFNPGNGGDLLTLLTAQGWVAL